MNLLIIHNAYGSYSGEEAVVDQQISLFKEMGHTVNVYRKTTEGQRGTAWGNVKGLFQGFYSPHSVKEIKNRMKTDKPDVVVIHNLYPYISPAVLKHIKNAGVPIIMTVHNYRLMCPTGLFIRNNRPCELCLKGKEWNCIRHNCEHSLLKSMGYAGRNWYARVTKAYRDNVDLYACITAFQTQKLIQAGYPADRMRVIPNFVNQVKEIQVESGNYVAVSGRMSQEKGIDLILDVARNTPQIQYAFAGSVRPGEHWMENLPENCTFLGHLSKEKLSEFYIRSRFLVIASRWYEGFPMTILDASSCSKPTIGPAHAGFLEIIDNGTTGSLFTPSDAEDLEKKIIELWNHPDKCSEFGQNAWKKLKKNYTAEVVKEKWETLLKIQSRPL